MSEEKKQVKRPKNSIKGINPVKAQQELRALFMITLIIGSLLILLNPIPYFFGPAYAVWQIPVSVAVMGIFYLLGNKYTKTQVVRAVFADSLYYLGFLFTFVALVAALISIDGFKADDIVGKMGPALVTTVVGMAARIYLTQFDAITSEPQQEVLDNIGELSSNLVDSLEKLRTLISSNEKIIEDHRKNSELQIAKFLESLNKLSFEGSQQALRELTTTLESASKAAISLENTSSEINTKFRTTSENLDSISGESSELKQKLQKTEEISVSINRLNNKIQSADDSFSESTRSLSNQIEKTEKDISNNLNSLDSKLSKADENISSAVDKMENKIQVAASEINLSSSLISADMKKIEEEAKSLNERMKSAINDVVGFFNRQK